MGGVVGGSLLSLVEAVSLGASTGALLSGLASVLPLVGRSLGVESVAEGVNGDSLPSLAAGLSLAAAVSLGTSAGALPSGLASALPPVGCSFDLEPAAERVGDSLPSLAAGLPLAAAVSLGASAGALPSILVSVLPSAGCSLGLESAAMGVACVSLASLGAGPSLAGVSFAGAAISLPGIGRLGLLCTRRW